MNILETKQKILAKAKISAEELKSLMDTEISKLCGLIDEEGALIIIAKHFGVYLKEFNDLNELLMQNIDSGIFQVVIIRDNGSKTVTSKKTKKEMTIHSFDIVDFKTVGLIGKLVIWNKPPSLDLAVDDLIILEDAILKKNEYTRLFEIECKRIIK